MEANGQPTVEAVMARVVRGDAVAEVTRYNTYDRRLQRFWTVSVRVGIRMVTGDRQTYEGAQTLAVQLLEARERWQAAQKLADEAFKAMETLAKAQPESAVQPAAVGADDEEPF